MFNFEKALNTLLYVTEALGTPDFHKVFKVLYFAEREHLAKYGSPIVCDKFISMDYGPVPSKVYDILKAAKNDNGLPIKEDVKELVDSSIAVVGNYRVQAKVSPDLDFFSETELECLDKQLATCRDLDFTTLSNTSHDSAWKKAQGNYEMSVYDIAEAGGADETMISYIRSVFENEATLSGCPS